MSLLSAAYGGEWIYLFSSAFAQVFPGVDPPEDPKARDWRFLAGKYQEVYLVLKQGHKEHLYDLEDFDEAGVEKDKVIAEAEAEDDDEERDHVASVARTAFALGHEHRSQGKGVDMDAAGRAAEEEQEPNKDLDAGAEADDDSDEEDAMPQTALQAIFGALRPQADPKQAAPKAGAKAAAKAKVGAKNAPTPARAGGRAAPATPTPRRVASAPPTPGQRSAPSTPAAARAEQPAGPPRARRVGRARSPDAAERAAADEPDSGQKRVGRPRASLTSAVKKLVDEARELYDAFEEGCRGLEVQAECDTHDKAGQKEWKRQALQEAKTIEATLAKGKKALSKVKKVPEGQDEDVDAVRDSLAQRCERLEAALRVVKAWITLNTTPIPPAIRFEFDSDSDSDSTPIRIRTDSERTPNGLRFDSDSIPIRFRSDSIRFGSGSTPIRLRFRFDSDSTPIQFRFGSDLIPFPFGPDRCRSESDRHSPPPPLRPAGGDCTSAERGRRAAQGPQGCGGDGCLLGELPREVRPVAC